jgi:Mrp family chromosome partitioning ATPase
MNPTASADADANLSTAHTGRRTLASYLAQNQSSVDSVAENTNHTSAMPPIASPTIASPPIASPTIEEEKPARTISQEAARSTLKMPAVGHFRTTRTDRPVMAETETAKTKFAAVAFQTAWEVDSLDWPEIQAKLLQEQERAFSKVAAHFCDACHQGLQVLLVTSPTAKEGRSTVACCIARSVAQRGIRVALLDGDIETPSLADSLNLDIAQGWNDAIVEGLPLEEVAIHSIADQLTVLPLTANESSPKLAHIDRYIGAVLERLRESFDLIVIDATFINSLDNRMIGTESNETIDAMILVTDGRSVEPQRMETAIRRIKNLGISSVGIVENFTST